MSQSDKQKIWDLYSQSIKSDILSIGQSQGSETVSEGWGFDATWQEEGPVFKILGTHYMRGTPAFKVAAEFSVNEETGNAQCSLMTSRRVGPNDGISNHNVFYNPTYLSSRFQKFIQEVEFYEVTGGKSRPKPSHLKFGS